MLFTCGNAGSFASYARHLLWRRISAVGVTRSARRRHQNNALFAWRLGLPATDIRHHYLLGGYMLSMVSTGMYRPRGLCSIACRNRRSGCARCGTTLADVKHRVKTGQTPLRRAGVTVWRCGLHVALLLLCPSCPPTLPTFGDFFRTGAGGVAATWAAGHGR